MEITEEELINRSQKYNSKTYQKGLREDEIAIPVSPTLRPIELRNVKLDHSYKWCSCGMSARQPLCDGSHNHTAFKPLEFQIVEEKERVFLCGCKLSKQKPFCDGNTCKELQD